MSSSGDADPMLVSHPHHPPPGSHPAAPSVGPSPDSHKKRSREAPSESKPRRMSMRTRNRTHDEASSAPNSVTPASSARAAGEVREPRNSEPEQKAKLPREDARHADITVTDPDSVTVTTISDPGSHTQTQVPVPVLRDQSDQQQQNQLLQDQSCVVSQQIGKEGKSQDRTNSNSKTVHGHLTRFKEAEAEKARDAITIDVDNVAVATHALSLANTPTSSTLPPPPSSSSRTGTDNNRKRRQSQDVKLPTLILHEVETKPKPEPIDVDMKDEEGVHVNIVPPSSGGASSMETNDTGTDVKGSPSHDIEPPPSSAPSTSAVTTPTLEVPNTSTPNLDSTTSTSAAPPSSSAALALAPVPAPIKPKSSKRRSRSPSPRPPVPPPRMQTIRLSIPLGGPDNYAVDILSLAKETGQRALTPPPIVKEGHETSDSEDDEDHKEGKEGKEEIPKGKGKGKAGRKSAAAEYYDLNDPFIDDSELAVDERTYFAQTKQQGFYVSSGEVALMKDKTRRSESGTREGSHGKDGSGDKRDRDGMGEKGGRGEGGAGTPKRPKSKRNVVPTIIPLAGSQVVGAAVATMPGPCSVPSYAGGKVSAKQEDYSYTNGNGNRDLNGEDSMDGVEDENMKLGSPIDVFASQLLAPGTRETPITLSDTEDVGGRVHSGSASAPPTNGHAQQGVKRKASDSGPSLSVSHSSSSLRGTSSNGPNTKKKRKTIEISSFHPSLQAALRTLQHAISLESFEVKGKFPPSLKPVLAKTALTAISVGEYNESFFSLMPRMFIYNKYTMTKLIKRTVYGEHQKLLGERQEELLKELKELAEDGWERAKEEWERSLSAWERRQEKAKAGATSVEGTPVPGSATPSVNGAVLPASGDAVSESGNGNVNGSGGSGGVVDVDMLDVQDGMMASQGEGQEGGPSPGPGGVGAATGAGVGGAQGQGQGQGQGGPTHSSQHMPTKRFRLTDRMKNIIWELVVLSNESCKIENEKNILENSSVLVSEQGLRKVLYQKIVSAFPEGWMSSGQISREVSVMKKRYEAQQAEGET